MEGYAEVRSTRLASGVAGIGFFVFILVAVVLVATTGVTEPDMETGAWDVVLSGMGRQTDRFVTAMWLFNLAHVLAIGFGLGLGSLLGRPAARVGSVALTLAALLFIIETMLSIGVAWGLAPGVASGTAGDATMELAATLLIVRNHIATLAGGLLAVSAAGFGQSLLDLGRARWGGWMALVLAAVGLLGSLTLLVPVLSTTRMAGIALFALWSGGMSVYLLRTPLERSDPASDQAGR